MPLDRFAKAKKINQKVNQFQDIAIDRIYPNPNNPRKLFDKDKLIELSKSIVKDGLLQPIIVKEVDNKFMIIGGERRYQACIIANLKTIKCNITNSENIAILSLIENLQREDLTDFETAKAIKELLDTGAYEKKQDLAMAINKSNSYISNCLKVLELNDEVIKQIEDTGDKTSISVLKTIAKQPQDKQKEILNDYKEGKIKRDEIGRDNAISTPSKTPPENEPKKFKKVMILDSEDSGNIIDFLSGLNLENKYKITIEEITT